jgi:hypothetical protein
MRCTPSIARSLPLALTLALAACAGSPTSTEVATGSEFLLRPGESATVEGAQLDLRFDVVASDSRCPADVVCIQLGTAEAIFTMSEARRPDTSLTLRTSPRDGQRATVGAWTITLVRLDPYPYTSRPIDASDYRAFLRVDPAS